MPTDLGPDHCVVGRGCLLVRGGELFAVAAAPIRVAKVFKGIFVAQIKTELFENLSKTCQSTLDLIDGDGVSLLGASADESYGLLGSESRPGQQVIGNKPVAYAPLKLARVVVVVTGLGGENSSRGIFWFLGLGILVMAAVLATLVQKCRGS